MYPQQNTQEFLQTDAMRAKTKEVGADGAAKAELELMIPTPAVDGGLLAKTS